MGKIVTVIEPECGLRPPIGDAPAGAPESPDMPKIALLFVVVLSLASCGVVDTMFDGFKHVSAVRNALAAATGMKPEVGFNWHNGRLNKVTVTFPRLYRAKPLTELADTVRLTVTKEFKQAPDDIVLAFSLGPQPVASNQPFHQPRVAAR